MISKLKNKLKTIPQKPGIYFWLDKAGKILYVGRATNLKTRIGQYFQKNIFTVLVKLVRKYQLEMFCLHFYARFRK